jgi:AcrR family transcriptional regulator
MPHENTAPDAAAFIPKPDGRKDNALATQTALRAAGRALFGKQGYKATSVGALCDAAGVTSGALYHHFGDKKTLFAAVAEELDAELVEHTHAVMLQTLEQSGDPWAAFISAIDSFVDLSANPQMRQIGLQDAPSVLGAEGWASIRDRHGLGAMTRAVQALQAAKLMLPGDASSIARMILGLLYGAADALPALEATHNAATPAALAALKAPIHAMLGGLRLGSR